MSDTAVAIPADPRPSIEKRSEIRGKLRQALDSMVWEGLSYDQAARTVNYHVRSMRRALGRPDVLAYLNRERQVLRASVSPRNIHRLVEIRDADNNMPAVQAIKVLEQLGEDQHSRGNSANAPPGVTIRIVNVVQPGQSVERQPVTTPVIEHDATVPAALAGGDRGEKP
jgi:hypothetical protein